MIKAINALGKKRTFKKRVWKKGIPQKYGWKEEIEVKPLPKAKEQIKAKPKPKAKTKAKENDPIQGEA